MSLGKLDELQAFVSVAEQGSFTAAAGSLGRTTSAVSKQVRGLEDRLGARLFNRTTRRVALTEIGRAFHERTRDLLVELEEAEQAVARMHSEPRGTLRVSAPMDFARTHLVAPIAAYAERFPEVELDVELADRTVDLVDEGFDVAIRVGALADSSLAMRRLAPCRQVLCASPAYLASRGTPRAPAALATHSCIGYAYAGTDRWRFRSGPAPWSGRIGQRHRANNGEMIRALAGAGQGIALLPTFLVCDDLRSGRLVEVLPDQLDSELSIVALFPHRKGLSTKVRLFVDHLVAHFGPAPSWDAVPAPVPTSPQQPDRAS